MGFEGLDFYHLPKEEIFLVSQKALIVNQKRQILLARIAVGLRGWQKKWGLPGGLLETNESLEEGLKREILEETGLKVEVGDLISVNDYWLPRFEFADGRIKRARFIALIYHCRFPGGEIKLSPEHDQFIWASREKAKKLRLAPDTKLTVEKFFNLR